MKTAQLYSIKPELRLCAGSGPAWRVAVATCRRFARVRISANDPGKKYDLTSIVVNHDTKKTSSSIYHFHHRIFEVPLISYFCWIVKIAFQAKGSIQFIIKLTVFKRKEFSHLNISFVSV